MKKALPILIVAVIVIAGLALYLANKNNTNSYGNNSDNSTARQANNMNMPAQAQSNNSSTPQAADKVTIQNMAFGPADITVKKGTTVTWTNQDSIAHTVVETDGQNGPKSETLDPGKSYTFTYDMVGTFKYHCSIHPDMTGMVTVTE